MELEIIKEMNVEKIGEEVETEIDRTLQWLLSQELNKTQLGAFTKEILKFQGRIFVTGVGRSGNVAESFAMRLMQLGYDVRVLGEPTAPPVKKGNLLIVISGGGEHKIKEVELVRQIGAKIIVITSYPDSTLGKLSDMVVYIPGRTEVLPESYEERRLKGLPVIPLGTTFELLTMIVLDSVIGVIAAFYKKTEEDLRRNHAWPEV